MRWRGINAKSLMNQDIYLDYSATTPVDPRVAELMCQYLTMAGAFGNPASRSHRLGWEAEAAVEKARQQVADLVHADPREIVWTSGATESDNLAIKGVARACRERGNHIVTSCIEHKAVLDSCQYLEKEGFTVTYLVPDEGGLIRPEAVAEAITDRTILVSIMHANNEIGTVNDIAAIGRVCKARDVLFHVDAVQSLGKVEVDLRTLHVHLMSFTAHKLYGPKGIGALYVRRSPAVRLEALIHGGGHERGLRSGTLPTHQIVGMGEAFRLAAEEIGQEREHVLRLRNRLLAGLADLEGMYVNGSLEHRLPGNLNVGFRCVGGESLLMSLRGLAVSSGSACNSATLEPSYVLSAIGLSHELAHGSLRITLGRFTTEGEVDQAVDMIRASVTKLRERSPQWRMRDVGDMPS